MIEEMDRTDWVEESKNITNIIGKNIGLIDLIQKENLEEYKTSKLFIDSKEKESIDHLTYKIYTLVERFYLSRKQLPSKLVLSKKDYKRLLEKTTIIDNNCILGIEIDLLREKKEYDTNRNSNFNFRNRKHSTSNRHSFAR